MARRRSGFAKTVNYKSWSSLLAFATEVNANGTIAGSAIDFLEPATVLRMVGGGGLVMFDATQQAGDSLNLAIGIGVISTDARVLGSTAVPDPNGDPEFPWLWWQQYNLESQLAAASTSEGPSMVRMPYFDSRSMRKVKPSESLIMVLEVFGAVGGPQTIIEIPAVRVLIGT